MMNVQKRILVVTSRAQKIKCCEIRQSFSRKFHRPGPVDNAVRALVFETLKFKSLNGLGQCVTRREVEAQGRHEKALNQIEKCSKRTQHYQIDFFPRGLINSNVYRRKVRRFPILKRRIRNGVNEITPEMHVNVFRNADTPI